MKMERPHFAELLGQLSIVADVGVGVPRETGIGAAVLAGRISRRIDLSPEDTAAAFYASLLRYIGCSVAIPETVNLTLGDVHGYQRALGLADMADAADLRHWLNLEMAPDAPEDEKCEVLDLLDGIHADSNIMNSVTKSHCDLARQLASDAGMPTGVTDALEQIYERHDGKGFPAGTEGAMLTFPARIMHVSTAFELQRRKMGVEWAVAQVRARIGGQFCPGICEAVLSDTAGLVADMDGPTLMDIYLSEAPDYEAFGKLTILDIARACAHNVDHRSVYTLGHSVAVSDLAVRAGTAAELSPEIIDHLRIAGLLHDVGKVGLPATLLNKAAPLSRAEQAQLEQHTYLTDSILRATAAFESYASLASSTHERADGSGYHRQLKSPEFHVQLLAACEAYMTLREERPGQPAKEAKETCKQLSEEAREGKWDPMVIRAIVHAESGPTASLDALPNGLSRREAEVVCLIARGLSNKEIAAKLYISPKTVEHHTAHIYDKIGTRGRAAAALFAVQNGLVSGR